MEDHDRMSCNVTSTGRAPEPASMGNISIVIGQGGVSYRHNVMDDSDSKTTREREKN